MKAWKILFWISTIALGFVNPLISFGLLVLYYLPGIVKSICSECSNETMVYEKYAECEKQPVKMNSYFDDTLEEMK